MSETKSINQRENWLSLKRNGNFPDLFGNNFGPSDFKSKVRAIFADTCGKRDLANENVFFLLQGRSKEQKTM